MAVIFKARIEGDAKHHDVIHITSYSNRRIRTDLFNMLNNAIHDVCDVWNGKKYWREVYYKFNHNGKRYEQFDKDNGTPCKNCIFNKETNGAGCQHPYYLDKGRCNRPYRLVEEEK